MHRYARGINGPSGCGLRPTFLRCRAVLTLSRRAAPPMEQLSAASRAICLPSLACFSFCEYKIIIAIYCVFVSHNSRGAAERKETPNRIDLESLYNDLLPSTANKINCRFQFLGSASLLRENGVEASPRSAKE